MAMGVEVTHVPYRGAGPVMQDLIGGRIDYMCDTIQTGAAQAKSGNVKGIAVLAPKRVAIIPDLATSGEQGLAGVEASVWNAFFFPKGTPDPIVRKMAKAVSDMLDNPSSAQAPRGPGWKSSRQSAAAPNTPRNSPEEIERWGKVVRAARIEPE
jgi:tripartite-type tricarboxylate transporter receptor subunit TctC